MTWENNGGAVLRLLVSPLTSVPAFSNCALKPCKVWSCGCTAAAAVIVVVGVASTTCGAGVVPACRRVFMRSSGLPMMMPAAPEM